MKKIAYIARGLSKNGVRSFLETNLQNLDNKEAEYYLFTDENDFSNKFLDLKVIYIKKANKLYWDNILLTKEILKLKINEVIYPKNIIPIFHLFLPITKTIYVHDLAFKYKKLNAYKKADSLYMNLFLGLSLIFANKIIAISNFTKNEIIRFYPFINHKKIKVEHNKINKIFKKNTNIKKINKIVKKYNLRLPFVFYCGSISPRKNILSLLNAFNEIKEEVPHDLYLLSSRQWNADKELEMIKKLAPRVRIIKDVPDEDLVVFYSIADLFVYPSLYEGFGLPIKEAEACGCRVLATKIPSLLEIYGSSIKIKNSQDFSNQIYNLIVNKK